MDFLRFACFVAVQSWMVADCLELVRLPPSIVKGPSSSILFRNDEMIELSCSASGFPAPTYEWIKNGRTFEMNHPNIRLVSDGGFQLTSASSLDEGFYQCKATNQWGIAYSNMSVVRRVFLGGAGSANVFDKVATEGDPLRIDFEQMRSYPKSQNRWQSADSVGTSDSTSIRELVRSKRMQWDENGTLFFSHVLLEDQLGTKIYKGVSYNPRVDISVGGSYTRLTVEKARGGIKPFGPYILFSSEAHSIGLEGENITLRCFFAGYPGPDVQWTGPRKVPPVRFTLDNFNTELKIFGLKQSHEGEYTCTGSNSNGTVPHRISLTVQAVPVFHNSSLSPHNLNATEGDNVTFKCKPYAKPEANVTWMINGRLLDVAHRPSRISVSRDGHSLTIRSVCRDCIDRHELGSSDLMVIQCNASNEYGYAFAAGYLNVLKKTTVTLTTNREVIIDKDSQHPMAVFQCLPFSDPSTPVALTWHRMVDNHQHVVHSRPSVVVVGNGTLTISAGNDTSEWMKHEGRYKCVANNEYSKAEEIVRIQVNVGQEILAHTATGILDLWWIFLLIAFLLLFLILILICYICIFCNRGDKYDVDGKERKNGNDPVKELVASGFHDYQRREIEPFKGSQNLLGSSVRLFGDDASEIGDHGGKFLENGSYRSMSYTDTSDRKKGRSEYI